MIWPPRPSHQPTWLLGSMLTIVVKTSASLYFHIHNYHDWLVSHLEGFNDSLYLNRVLSGCVASKLLCKWCEIYELIFKTQCSNRNDILSHYYRIGSFIWPVLLHYRWCQRRRIFHLEMFFFCWETQSHFHVYIYMAILNFTFSKHNSWIQISSWNPKCCFGNLAIIEICCSIIHQSK